MILLIDLRQFLYGTLETRRELRPKCIPQLFLWFCLLMHLLIPAAPQPPRATAEHLSSCLVSPGGRALANFVLPWGPGICLEPRSNRLCNHDDQMLFMMMPRL